MLISHSHKFIFVHIYKCGGSSIVESLKHFGGQCDDIPYHFLGREIKESIESGNSPYPLLAENQTFVRNPFDFLVSLFYWIRMNTGHDMCDYLNSMTFDDFLRIIETPELQPDTFEHGHARIFRRPLSMFVQDEHGQCILDYVGKLETVDRQFQEICDSLSIPNTLGKYNESIRPKNYRDCYSKEGQAIVEKVFQRDFEVFEYEF